jgi:hypothetical protein
MSLKKWLSIALEVLVMMGLAFVGFNLAFMFFALFVNLAIRFIQPLINEQAWILMSSLRWIGLGLLIALMALLMRFKLPPSVKAAIFAVPLMALNIMIGIAFYPQPEWIILSIGAALNLIICVGLWLRKVSWHYYFVTLYNAILATLIILLNIDV